MNVVVFVDLLMGHPAVVGSNPTRHVHYVHHLKII